MVSPFAGAAISLTRMSITKRLGGDAGLAELADPIRSPDDHPNRHPWIGTAGAVDGIDAKVRIGEQGVDRGSERGHDSADAMIWLRTDLPIMMLTASNRMNMAI